MSIMANESATVVQRLWNYCNVLRDDGVSFRKSQNRIQDPAKLRRLIELINGETWMGMDIDVKGER